MRYFPNKSQLDRLADGHTHVPVWGELLADRDTPGDWESFTLIPQDSGKVAFQTSNGSYVAADYGLTGTRKGVLIGDRKQISDWEQFTIVLDTALVQ